MLKIVKTKLTTDLNQKSNEQLFERAETVEEQHESEYQLQKTKLSLQVPFKLPIGRKTSEQRDKLLCSNQDYKIPITKTRNTEIKERPQKEDHIKKKY